MVLALALPIKIPNNLSCNYKSSAPHGVAQALNYTDRLSRIHIICLISDVDTTGFLGPTHIILATGKVANAENPDRENSKCRYNRQGRKANVGAGTATATEPTREHKQYATQGPTTYLCT